MIALIIGGLAAILGIVMLIVGKKEDCDEFVCSGVAVTILSIAIVFTLLFCGGSIYKDDNTKRLAEKEYIEYCLETRPSLYAIKEAETYNSNVEFGNNYFCRFNKEDRSEFKIDIDKYISGDNNE